MKEELHHRLNDNTPLSIIPFKSNFLKRMLNFDPPLVNSASPWATTKEQLQVLYDCVYTGAVTTRTSLLSSGFEHDNAVHQYGFFAAHQPFRKGEHGTTEFKSGSHGTRDVSSLNTLGYSPLPLKAYVKIMREIYEENQLYSRRQKPVIFSVTGSPDDVVTAYNHINSQKSLTKDARFLMEINLSCPNIAGVPPPAYCKSELVRYLTHLHSRQTPTNETSTPLEETKIGIKTPPYTHQGQFDDLISALLESTSEYQTIPISFITATNTLGNCLILNPSDDCSPALKSANGTGIGGLAGAALHPLALGNVSTLRRMLDSHYRLRNIDIIGVGGVMDGAGFRRMLNVGADVVAVGTALGIRGMNVFESIIKEVKSSS